MGKPLEGVKIIDMSTFIAVPMCARFFAEFGAEVIKVEPKGGDVVRYNGASEGRSDSPYENTTWDLENAHKRGLTLDLKSPEGMEILMKLIDESDMFLTNWRPQALEKLGLDYESLKVKFPSLVYGSLTGFGEEGPDADLPGYDFTAFWARAGILGTLYQKESTPINLVPGIGDHISGMFLAAGLMIALDKAHRTGEGDKVSTNLLHSSIFIQAIPMQAAQYTDLGTKYPTSRSVAENPFNNTYKSSDGRFIQISMPPFDIFYPRFMPLIGREDLADNPRYKMKNITENKLHGEFIRILDDAFATKTLAEWCEIFVAADIPHSVVQTWEEVLEDEQAWAIGAFESVEYPSGKRTMIRPPVKIDSADQLKYSRGPYLGEHSIEIIQELGYTEEQIKEMSAKGVFNTWDEIKEK